MDSADLFKLFVSLTMRHATFHEWRDAANEKMSGDEAVAAYRAAFQTSVAFMRDRKIPIDEFVVSDIPDPLALARSLYEVISAIAPAIFTEAILVDDEDIGRVFRVMECVFFDAAIKTVRSRSGLEDHPSLLRNALVMSIGDYTTMVEQSLSPTTTETIQ